MVTFSISVSGFFLTFSSLLALTESNSKLKFLKYSTVNKIKIMSHVINSKSSGNPEHEDHDAFTWS